MLPARRSSLHQPARLPRGLAWCLTAGLMVFAAAGCGPTPKKPELKPEPVLTQPEPAKQPVAPQPAAPVEDSAGKPTPQPAAPFAPPPLEALDRDTKWIDRPVREALAELAKELEQEPSLATAAEALALENTSADNNAKIPSAGCRRRGRPTMPPGSTATSRSISTAPTRSWRAPRPSRTCSA
jgi:hypothetical protein